MIQIKPWLGAALCVLAACSPEPPFEDPPENPPTLEPVFYRGADLSYVNEMEDCGAEYYSEAGEATDPYTLFAEVGTNLARVRLWHSPDWTDYSTLEDVTKAIRRAKEAGMQVLLDFHYSDDWADPGKQEIPAAWVGVIDNTPALADSLYAYTYTTLAYLAEQSLAPDMVQVGNEINPMILQQGDLEWPIDWERNTTLINRGIKAVRDAARNLDVDMGVMLHIAQPENALWWFEQATAAGVSDYDWIGLSYYPIWSEYGLDNVGSAFTMLMDTYQKRLMVVETAYPYTLENADPANNILGEDALLPGLPASEEGQRGYLIRLEEIIADVGGEGLIYWEPAWVSTDCSTRWGQGSHWDNATLFDHQNRPTLGMDWYAHERTEN